MYDFCKQICDQYALMKANIKKNNQYNQVKRSNNEK